jgi:anthranilate/para-aminobenzoate synthase component I
VAQVHHDVRVVGEEPAAVDELSSLLLRGGCQQRATVKHFEAPEPAAVHKERILMALELIRAGEIYQVNLARRLRVAVEGHPISLLESLGQRSRFAYGAAMRLGELDVVSTSPELFLRMTRGGRLYTAPIKGTRPRGTDARADRLELENLSTSEKEAAELTMILDVERNDLGKVAEVGSVRLLQPPRVTTHPTLHHRNALLGAVLRPECGVEELLRVMLPSGSVTGAPKVRAMQVIAELEAERRGLYTGAFGTLSHERELTLAMAIRTLTARQGAGHYFAGGGIVADSVSEAEVRETGWKALQLVPGP